MFDLQYMDYSENYSDSVLHYLDGGCTSSGKTLKKIKKYVKVL